MSEDFRRQRSRGIGYIAIGAVATAAIWFAVDRLSPPLAGMGSVTARLVFALKCLCAAALFCLVGGVEAVAHERLVSPAFDPLAGFETRRLRVNQRYLQNTLEQFVVFAVGLLGLAAIAGDMRTVSASAVAWVVSRFAFWLGYHRSAAARGLGASGMAIGMLMLLYVSSRFGGELAGTPGAVAAVVLFLALEAVLVWATRPLAAGGPDLETPH